MLHQIFRQENETQRSEKNFVFLPDSKLHYKVFLRYFFPKGFTFSLTQGAILKHEQYVDRPGNQTLASSLDTSLLVVVPKINSEMCPVWLQEINFMLFRAFTKEEAVYTWF